jgi:hypothetical protein
VPSNGVCKSGFSNILKNTALIMAEKTILTNEEVTLEVSFASKSG